MATTKKRSRARRSAQLQRLTAVYVPAPDGGFCAWIQEAVGVNTQGDTFEEARENLIEALLLIYEDAPEQIGVKPTESLPPGALVEAIFLVKPREAPRSRPRA
jgi:predicted RNase H-like HicB family nuclease